MDSSHPLKAKEKVLFVLPTVVIFYITLEMFIKYVLFIKPAITSNQVSPQEPMFYVLVAIITLLIFFYWNIICRTRKLFDNYKLLFSVLTGLIVLLKLLTDNFTVLLFASLVS